MFLEDEFQHVLNNGVKITVSCSAEVYRDEMEQPWVDDLAVGVATDDTPYIKDLPQSLAAAMGEITERACSRMLETFDEEMSQFKRGAS